MNGQDDFALGVAFGEITEGFGGGAQRVTSIDDGYNFSRLKKSCQKGQIVVVDFCYEETKFLAANP